MHRNNYCFNSQKVSESVSYGLKTLYQMLIKKLCCVLVVEYLLSELLIISIVRMAYLNKYYKNEAPNVRTLTCMLRGYITPLLRKIDVR